MLFPTAPLPPCTVLDSLSKSVISLVVEVVVVGVVLVVDTDEDESDDEDDG